MTILRVGDVPSSKQPRKIRKVPLRHRCVGTNIGNNNKAGSRRSTVIAQLRTIDNQIPTAPVLISKPRIDDTMDGDDKNTPNTQQQRRNRSSYYDSNDNSQCPPANQTAAPVISSSTVRSVSPIRRESTNKICRSQSNGSNNAVTIAGARCFTVPIKFRDDTIARPTSPTSSMTLMEIDEVEPVSTSESEEGNIQQTTKSVRTPRRRVHFVDNVKVTEIPNRRTYTLEQHYQMYNNSMAIRNMARRNIAEYHYEGRDWRLAIEEDAFVRSYYDGTLIHPAHIPNYNGVPVKISSDCSA